MKYKLINHQLHCIHWSNKCINDNWITGECFSFPCIYNLNMDIENHIINNNIQWAVQHLQDNDESIKRIAKYIIENNK
jgi:hypothetical protein